MKLEGRKAIVTGASRGIGRAIALALADEGADVAVNYMSSEAAAQAVVQEIEKRGRRSLAVRADVSDFPDTFRMAQDVSTAFGHVDILVNNAGINSDKTFVKMDHAAWRKVLAINLDGVFNCTKVFIDDMLKRGYGRIVNITSVIGQIGNFGQANYAAAKAGQFGLTTALARELGSRNVRVNAILPGVLPTKMTASRSPDEMQQFAAANALGRINSVEEVARFIVFLAGTQNISGQLFQLDSRIAPWT